MPALYKIFETKQFLKDLQNLPDNIKDKILLKLERFVYPQLKAEPHYGGNIKKLVNWKPETWRYRIGNFRLFYEIDSQTKIVFIIALENRQSAY